MSTKAAAALSKDDNAFPKGCYIALMGVTGSGKSSFISTLCTEAEITIGHSLQSCTRAVEYYPVQWTKDTTVYLVDTPGFDDTNRSDAMVLKELAASLSSMYEGDIKLSGIIYLHQISQDRMGGSARQNLLMFSKLCGENFMSNVILATTMWDITDRAIGEKREIELRDTDDFWGYMVKRGSTILRHDRKEMSAKDIIKYLIKKDPMALDLQTELVDRKLPLNDTAAGQEVDSKLTQARREMQQRIDDLNMDLEEAKSINNVGMARDLMDQRNDMTARIEEIIKQQEDLRIDLERVYEEKAAKLQQQLEKVTTEHAELQAKYDAEVKTHAHASLPCIHDLDRWSVIMSLFDTHYWFGGFRNDFGSVPSDLPSERRPFPQFNGNRVVVFGDSDSWYVQYREYINDNSFEDRQVFSSNFRQLYPLLHRFLIEHTHETPICISIGGKGQYFVRTKSGCSHKVNGHIPNPSEFHKLWFGHGKCYVGIKKIVDGSETRYESTMQLNGYDEELTRTIEQTPMLIRQMALNPLNKSQWAVLWPNGKTIYSRRTMSFTPDLYESFAFVNFGTIWNGAQHSMQGDAANNKAPVGVTLVQQGGRKWYMPWTRHKRKVSYSNLSNSS